MSRLDEAFVVADESESQTKDEQMNAILWIMRHLCDDYHCVDHDECAVCKCEPECLDQWIED